MKSKSRRKKINLTPGGIPKIIHQIWIGNSDPPKLNLLYMNTCNDMKGWEYKLWTDKDITKKNFPLTYNIIQDIIQVGIDDNKINKKFAQVADLMRLEILFRNGGVYIDTTAECLKNFDTLFDNEDYTFIVSNEDPCGFDCVNSEGEYYISNSFIASSKRHPVLRNLLSVGRLKKIDIYSYKINKETGPYYLGRHIQKIMKKHHITMIPSDLIYPTRYESEYDIERPDKCFKYKKTKKTNMELRNKHDDSIFLEYPCKSYSKSYLIKHFEAGGTWR